MKKVLFVLLILVLALPVFAAPKTYDVKSFDAFNFFTDKKVNADIFKDYDVTMVNFFTTTCVYCMCELDSLGQVKQRMPEGCNIIAVCADAYDFGEALEDVSNAFTPDFMLLKMTGDQLAKVPFVIGYPTTLYVDRNGNILEVVYEPLNHPTEMYLEKMNESLAKVRGK